MSEIYTPDDDRPHVPSHICGRCRKEFKRGDRIFPAYIFEQKGNNPNNLGNTGAYISEEYEFVHADCSNPLLKGGIHGA